jgi:hypothetical protein
LQYRLTLLVFIVIDAVDPVAVLIKLVKAELVPHIPREREKYGEAYGESDDVDSGE